MNFNSASTKAVLIFAASLFEDLERRKFPKKFSELVGIPSFDASVTDRADVHIFTTDSGFDIDQFSNLVRHAGIFIHPQEGRTFGERLSHAIDDLWRLGYREIVIVGRDCPELQNSDIHSAFDQLAQFRLVLGPDHRGGCYLIALHAEDRHKLLRVRWQENTDSVQLQEIFGPGVTFLLSVKHDLDSIADIRLLAGTNTKSGFIARVLLREFSQHTRRKIDFPAHICLPVDLIRPFWQLPPPQKI